MSARCIHQPIKNAHGGLYCNLCGTVLYMPPEWLVTVRKSGTEKHQTRKLFAANEADAFRRTADLIGGPKASSYELVKASRV